MHCFTFTLHYITLHCIALLHIYITLHYITLPSQPMPPLGDHLGDLTSELNVGDLIVEFAFLRVT